MIFISYSSNDKVIASEIKTDLENSYFSCFLAHDDIGATQDWQDVTIATLRRCKAFVGLVTPNFNASAFCQQELC